MVAGAGGESKQDGGSDVEAGHINGAKPASSDRQLEDAVQRSVNDLEQERKERERSGLTPARHVRNGSRSSPGGTAPGGGLDCSIAAPARGS